MLSVDWEGAEAGGGGGGIFADSFAFVLLHPKIANKAATEIVRIRDELFIVFQSLE